jgi:pilus assembly protein Flp/PilA
MRQAGIGRGDLPKEEHMLRIYEVMLAKLAAVRGDEEGQALVEYALILGLVSIVAIGALTLLGGNINNILNQIAGAV